MELGLGILGLTPVVFWALTPRELECIVRGRSQHLSDAGAPSRDDLADLMSLFPDQG